MKRSTFIKNTVVSTAGIFITKNLMLNTTTNIGKIWTRNSIIPFSCIGQNILIHNGKEFKKILITREKVGFKCGEFSLTRRHNHKPKKTQKIISKKK